MDCCHLSMGGCYALRGILLPADNTMHDALLFLCVHPFPFDMSLLPSYCWTASALNRNRLVPLDDSSFSFHEAHCPIFVDMLNHYFTCLSIARKFAIFAH
ncbi:unnamed protein product [Triticum turgidum subsp. durum]|uniref:Uncharacterized protein n=1 Tax=Triticum turgidum subsp. durum TaxID=4567 RepID=A0A9R0ZNF3_TRITD|nr:unnamed protein product [Triticum turgidum subsp. durum]